MSLLGDARFAIRTLSRSPGFTAVVVLTLALGIGAAAAMFSVVEAVVLRPLDYPEPQQLVRITSELRGFGATDTGVSAAELFDYKARDDLFVAVAGILPISANVTSGGAPERIDMLLVSWDYFHVLGVAPALGRIFRPEDDTPDVANIAVVSDAFWRRSLGADPQAVGRTIVIDSDPIFVVGVMPSAFEHPGRTLQSHVDVWSPAGFREDGSVDLRRSRRRLEGALARLRPGVTVEQVQARLDEYGNAVSGQFQSEYPPENGWKPLVIPLQDDMVGALATPMFVLLSGVALLLLVACVNITQLVFARSFTRGQELAIRRALGATGGRLVCQLGVESAVLVGAGALLSVLVASWGLRTLVALAPARIPRLDDVSLDLNVILVTGAISFAAVVLSAFVPVLHGARSAPLGGLKEGSSRTVDRRAVRWRSMLVAAEVAMATILLVGAGLFVRTVAGLLNVPVGFETDGLLTARFTLPMPNDASRAVYLDHSRRVSFYREALGRIQALPGVERAAMSSQVPLGGFNRPLFVEVQDRVGSTNVRPVVHTFQVSPGYFETMRMRVLSGRPFTDADRTGSEPVAVVSETAAKMFWQERNPIGERLRFSADAPWMTVVGVATDVLHRRLAEQAQPILYLPLDQWSDRSLALLVRTRADVQNLADMIAREVRAVEPDLPVYAVRTMAELVDAAVAQRQFLMRVLIAFGASATVLALIGIYGVMAYSVSQRTREIAIRMAIGARNADVTRMIMRVGIVLTAAGIAVGAGLSLWLSQLVESQLFGIQPSDPLTMSVVLLVMIVVAAIAAYVPARRAARVDPSAALRSS